MIISPLPSLPIVWRRGLRAALLAGALSCFSPQTMAAGLRLVCDVGGRALEPARFAQGKVLLSDGAQEIEAPENAQWRLEGDLRENADMLLLSPVYLIYERRNNSGNETWDAQRPIHAVVSTRHELVSKREGKPAHSYFLQNWPEGTNGDALLVSAWVLDGKARHVQAGIIPASETNDFSRTSLFLLTREEGRGQAVMLLWRPGGFVAPAPRLGPGLAQEAVVAAVFDDAAALAALIKQGMDPSKARGKQNHTLLHFAAEAGSMRALEVLLKAAPRLVDAPGELEDKTRQTPLSWAVSKGRVDAVKRLLAAKANPNADFGNPRIMLASIALLHGHAEVLSVLLANGARTKTRGTFAESTLDHALMRGDCEMADMLCGKKGLERDMLEELRNGDPLRVLLRNKHHGMAMWLLQRGLRIKKPAETTTATSSGFSGAMRVRTTLTTTTSTKEMSSALENDDLYTAAVLNYSVDKADTVLRAVLALMPGRKDEERFAEIIMGACRELLEAEKNQQKELNNDSAKVALWDASPLAEASLAGCLPLVRQLLNAKCPLNKPLHKGRQALHYAAAGNATETAAFLIEKGALISVPDNSGLAPLDVALMNGAVDVARLLAAKGARINPASHHAGELLIEAIRLDLPEVALPAVRAGIAAKPGVLSLCPAWRFAELLGARACMAALSENAGSGTESRAGVPVARASELDRLPSVSKRAVLRSCASVLEYRPEITVNVRTLVGPEGDVHACLPEEGTDAPATLQKSAMDHVRRCEFSPLRANGKPVAAWVVIPVVFAAHEEPFGTNELPAKMSADVMPRVVSRPSPTFPAAEKLAGKDGLATVLFVVSKNGTVEKESVDVFRATTRGYAEAAAKGVEKWKFDPGLRDSEPVRARMSIPVVFQLK